MRADQIVVLQQTDTSYLLAWSTLDLTMVMWVAIGPCAHSILSWSKGEEDLSINIQGCSAIAAHSGHKIRAK